MQFFFEKKKKKSRKLVPLRQVQFQCKSEPIFFADFPFAEFFSYRQDNHHLNALQRPCVYVLYYFVSDPEKNKGNDHTIGLAIVIPISTICLLCICVFFIMKHSAKKSKRGRETEEAKFDFRDVSTASESFSIFNTLPWFKFECAVQRMTVSFFSFFP